MRWTVGFNPTASSERCERRLQPRAVGRVLGRATTERWTLSAAQGCHACKAEFGPRQAAGQIGFSVKKITDHSFYFFYSFFEQISHGFFYSNYSIENLIREFTSNRNISEKIKVNEFYSCFCCK
jgi:hypothetical protein